MINWDDYRFFLAIARSQSIRQASRELAVSHSTVLRRISLLEESLGVRLFERLPSGYFTTEAGEELTAFAERIEEETIAIERRVAGRDTHLHGKIRITLPGIVASHLIMPDLVKFRLLHPGIELEVNTAYTEADLSKREADVAIRVSNNPPENLFGRRLLDVVRAAYVNRNVLEKYLSSNHDTSGLSWIGMLDQKSSRDWIEKSDHPDIPVGASIDDLQATLEAVKAGMGMAILPCFVGDSEPDLYRMPPGNTQTYQSLWVLTHEDLRNTARIRVFLTYISAAIENYVELITGEKPKPYPVYF